MYADVRSKYKVANANVKQSGTHDNDFWNFFNGQLDLLYLYQSITANPGIEIGVAALLQSHLSLNSNDTGPFSNEPFTPISVNDGRRNKQNEFVEIMNELENSGMRSEVGKKKIENIDSLNVYGNKRIALQREKHYIEKDRIVSKRIRSLRREAASESKDVIKADIPTKIASYQKKYLHRYESRLIWLSNMDCKRLITKYLFYLQLFIYNCKLESMQTDTDWM